MHTDPNRFGCGQSRSALHNGHVAAASDVLVSIYSGDLRFAIGRQTPSNEHYLCQSRLSPARGRSGGGATAMCATSFGGHINMDIIVSLKREQLNLSRDLFRQRVFDAFSHRARFFCARFAVFSALRILQMLWFAAAVVFVIAVAAALISDGWGQQRAACNVWQRGDGATTVDFFNLDSKITCKSN